MEKAAHLGSGIGKIGLIKRDMTKLGAGRDVSVIWRDEWAALWRHGQLTPEGYEPHGCGTSLYAALAAPERIRGLVLMNPPTAWETRAVQAAMYGQMADMIDTNGIDFLLNMMQQQPAMGPSWQTQPYAEMMENMATHFKSLDPKVLTRVLRGSQLANLPPAVELEAIHAPALILAWTEDVGHPISSAKEVARRLPNSELRIAHNAAEVATWTDDIRKFVTALA